MLRTFFCYLHVICFVGKPWMVGLCVLSTVESPLCHWSQTPGKPVAVELLRINNVLPVCHGKGLRSRLFHRGRHLTEIKYDKFVRIISLHFSLTQRRLAHFTVLSSMIMILEGREKNLSQGAHISVVHIKVCHACVQQHRTAPLNTERGWHLLSWWLLTEWQFSCKWDTLRPWWRHGVLMSQHKYV